MLILVLWMGIIYLVKWMNELVCMLADWCGERGYTELAYRLADWGDTLEVLLIRACTKYISLVTEWYPVPEDDA